MAGENDIQGKRENKINRKEVGRGKQNKRAMGRGK